VRRAIPTMSRIARHPSPTDTQVVEAIFGGRRLEIPLDHEHAIAAAGSAGQPRTGHPPENLDLGFGHLVAGLQGVGGEKEHVLDL
jgi:hypothetical protein